MTAAVEVVPGFCKLTKATATALLLLLTSCSVPSGVSVNVPEPAHIYGRQPTPEEAAQIARYYDAWAQQQLYAQVGLAMQYAGYIAQPKSAFVRACYNDHVVLMP